jgi:biotin carboxyl carrier protein
METGAAPAKPRMSRRNRFLIFVVAWAIVLMPFLFWRSTWFGRPLSNAELTQYLRDDSKPRHIQHALVQLGERMNRQPAAASAPFYPELLRLSSHPVEEIRSTDAWVIGQAPTTPEFHQALLNMLNDASFNVRSNAALGLVRYGDAAGHTQIMAMLQPVQVKANSSTAGRVTAVATAGDPIRAGTMVVRVESNGQSTDVRSPITGTLTSVLVRKDDSISVGTPIAEIAPGTDQVWEALRALLLIGTSADLPEVRKWERDTRGIANRVRQQATETEKAILARQARSPS